MTAFDPRPVTLRGRTVRLEPLESRHLPDLFAASADEAIWQYLPIARPATLPALEHWADEAWRAMAEGTQVPFAVVLEEAGAAIGSTRYLDIQRPHRNLEIGWTWLGTAHRRTRVNTECKLLLLAHAFEAQGAIRVCFKTDSRNLTSQRAIERLGARREGVFRQHMIVRDGVLRDSVYYGITDQEWPAVKARLDGMLARVD